MRTMLEDQVRDAILALFVDFPVVSWQEIISINKPHFTVKLLADEGNEMYMENVIRQATTEESLIYYGKQAMRSLELRREIRTAVNTEDWVAVTNLAGKLQDLKNQHVSPSDSMEKIADKLNQNGKLWVLVE